MKKSILFVMESLGIGGAEKSLVTLLSMIDPKRYDIDLFLFRHSGAFMEQIPKNVTLLSKDESAVLFEKNFKTAWFHYAVKMDWKRSWHSFAWLIGCCLNRYLLRKPEYYGWKHLKKIYAKIDKKYDVAIGFLEKKTTYFVTDQVIAEKKYAFMHTDYDAIPHDKKLDERSYRQLDGLVVVSEHTGDTMLRQFPFMQGKVHTIKNMVAPEVIHRLAQEPVPELEQCKEGTVKLVTVGRLTRPKRIDGAITILKKLRETGVDAEWFVIGEGEERQNLERQIQEMELVGKFHLLGSRANPYPYMSGCDIYVQPSRWEGYGITVAEAKVLCKPIVASDIPEFREQLEHGITGLIASEENAFVDEIRMLIKDSQIGKSLMDALKQEKSNQNELMKFYAMLEET